MAGRCRTWWASSGASGRNTDLIVVDGSVVVEAALSKVGLAPLVRHEPTAPALLWSEATSALHELRFRGDIAEDVARAALDRIATSSIERRAPRRLQLEAWEIANSLGWAKTYDAEYIALARLQRCPLVTVDGRLRRGAGHLIEILGPQDLR